MPLHEFRLASEYKVHYTQPSASSEGIRASDSFLAAERSEGIWLRVVRRTLIFEREYSRRRP